LGFEDFGIYQEKPAIATPTTAADETPQDSEEKPNKKNEEEQ
jgi:hypothetical protein